MANYQSQKYKFTTEVDLLKAYGEEWPSAWAAKKLDTFEKKKEFLGDCCKKTFSVNSLASIELSQYGFKVKNKISINSKLKNIFENVLSEISKIKEYEIRSVGGYLFRYKKNSSVLKNVRDSKDYEKAKEWYCKKWKKDATESMKSSWWNEHWAEGAAEYDLDNDSVKTDYLSNHSFGSAIDINPIENGMGVTEWDMLPKIVEIFRINGFYWGGYYKSSKDPMHFEYYLNDLVNVKKTASFSLPLDITTLETKLSPTADAFAKYYTHTEQEFTGGYFPIGANTSWHGGLHLKGTEAIPVHAIAPGTVVCARMPVQDPQKDQLAYGSRNFVLIRHDNNAKPWYSLYYHLKSIAMDSEEAQKISWLNASFLKFKKNRNFREEPNEKSTILKTFQANADEAEIIDKSQSPWYEVVDPATGSSGFVNFAADVADEVAKPSADLSDKFSQGDAVYQIGKTVNAGDIIGYVGKGIHFENGARADADIIHWEIFSSELIGQDWEQIEDPDDNYTCNSETLIKLVDKDRDNELEPDEVIDFFADEQKAAAMRGYACKFKSDWSVDWKSFSEELKKQNILAYPEKLSLYNFWPDACKCDTTLQADGKVWHYNPIAFIEKMQKSAQGEPSAGAAAAQPAPSAEFDIEISAQSESGARTVKANSVLSIVPKLQSKSVLKCRTTTNEEVDWELSGYAVEKKRGSEVSFDVKHWLFNVPDFPWWFPKAAPKTAEVVAKDSKGKLHKTTLKIYPGNVEAHDLDLTKIPLLNGLKTFFEILEKDLVKFSGVTIKASILKGSMSLKSEFKEHNDNTAFYTYEFSAGFSPLAAIAVEKDFGPAAILPPPLQRFADYIKCTLSAGASVDLTGTVSKDGPNEVTWKLAPSAKLLEIGVEIGTNFKEKTLGQTIKKVIDAKIGAATSVDAEFAPIRDPSKIGFLTTIKCSGLVASGYIVAFDGFYKYKKQIVLFKEKVFVENKEWLCIS
jgi:hypothetical protein